MDFFSVVLIGFSLAADAMTAAVCCGIRSSGRSLKLALMTAVLFASFQMMMPLLGWSIGKVGSNMAGKFEKYIAFGILLFFGIRMLWDARKSIHLPLGPIKVKELCLLAVATSMDALAIGMTLPAVSGALHPSAMAVTLIIIGSITFFLSFMP